MPSPEIPPSLPPTAPKPPDPDISIALSYLSDHVKDLQKYMEEADDSTYSDLCDSVEDYEYSIEVLRSAPPSARSWEDFERALSRLTLPSEETYWVVDVCPALWNDLFVHYMFEPGSELYFEGSGLNLLFKVDGLSFYSQLYPGKYYSELEPDVALITGGVYKSSFRLYLPPGSLSLQARETYRLMREQEHSIEEAHQTAGEVQTRYGAPAPTTPSSASPQVSI